mmetsp:Transcript_118655/g.378214  ORF Transcript_118655/g.378214 Transcript_118655/m.378214 type:complete len:214 (+) Transcript_118655:2267-2908(+)
MNSAARPCLRMLTAETAQPQTLAAAGAAAADAAAASAAAAAAAAAAVAAVFAAAAAAAAAAPAAADAAPAAASAAAAAASAAAASAPAPDAADHGPAAARPRWPAAPPAAARPKWPAAARLPRWLQPRAAGARGRPWRTSESPRGRCPCWPRRGRQPACHFGRRRATISRGATPATDSERSAACREGPAGAPAAELERLEQGRLVAPPADSEW